jgi:hypothetical protein
MTSPKGNWSQLTWSPINEVRLEMLVRAALPFKKHSTKNVFCYSQEALLDVNYASNKRDLRRPKMKNC